MERMGIWHTDSNSVVYCISGIDFDYRKEGVKMSVNIKNVTVTFKNQVRAVDHVNLEIPHGVYGLLGENGAGKTTLMRVLTTVLTPSDGEVYLDGIRYGTGKDEVIRQKIGYLPQELNLYPGLSVQDCLEYLGELSGIPKEECKKRIRYYLEKTGLTNHRKKKMRQLSGGMKRRVGLIQALLNEPEFLIVDEPTTGLDPEERVRIRNLLVDFSEGRTVLFSTHVVEDIAATCSKLAVMRKGSFLYTGTVQALLSRAKGKIWTANVADDTEAKRLEKQYRTTSKQYTEEGMTVKIISDVKPDIDCTQPKITLEDAYLYLMMEKKKQ